MKVINAPFSELKIFSLDIHKDNRGYFIETYNSHGFNQLGLNSEFVQDNESYSTKNVLRGMHFQFPNSQEKLIRVLSGAVFEVVVDIRKHSQTFGKWFGHKLTGRKKEILYVPEGFANGFYVMSNHAILAYKTSRYYLPSKEFTLAWNDPTIGINWPLCSGKNPILSSKDLSGLTWNEVLSIIK